MLIENFAGGTLAGWGFDPPALCRDQPRLIVGSLSGFGQTGPWSRRPSYDIITQAAGGFMSLTGFPDDPPTRGGGSLGDYVQGLFGAIGILAAVVARHTTGRGQVVDVSGQDGMFSLLDNWPTLHAATGRLPLRVGNRHLATAPYDCYRARDVLKKLNLPMTETDVLCVDLPNRPGALADVATLLGKNHININYAYVTSGAPGGRTTGGGDSSGARR